MTGYKKLYEVSNAVEAHMLRDLLDQQGIQVFIEGEHLQGGVGDLPAGGLVRLVVDEAHYAEAANFLSEWDTKQVEESKPAPLAIKRFGGFGMFFMGFGLGLVLMYAYFFLPRSTQINPDGKWTYNLSGKPVLSEFDRNLDGKIDLKQSYDVNGFVEAAESDDDFDGVFETIVHDRLNNPTLTEIDTDHDGFYDLKFNYKDGVVQSSEAIFPTTGVSRKTCYFHLSLMTYCDLDIDLDGKMDTRIEYDAIGEEKKRDKL